MIIQHDPSEVCAYLAREVDRVTHLTGRGVESFVQNTSAHLTNWNALRAPANRLQHERLSDLVSALNDLAEYLRDGQMTTLTDTEDLKRAAKKAIEAFGDVFKVS